MLPRRVWILQMSGVRFAFYEHFEGATDKRSGDLPGDLVLFGHGNPAALLFCPGGNLTGHFPGSRSILLRIAKYAEPFEPRRANKIQQRPKTRFRFTGKT